jgi:hypothetical protein
MDPTLNATLQATSSYTAHIDFTLLALLCLDILFLIVAELLARIVRG